MARSRQVLLAATLAALLPGCQAYEDYCPWTWHLSTSPTTGRLVLRSEGNRQWHHPPTPLRLRDSVPPPAEPEGAGPSAGAATERAGGTEAVREAEARFRECGEIDGRKVYRRLLPSERLASELAAQDRR